MKTRWTVYGILLFLIGIALAGGRAAGTPAAAAPPRAAFNADCETLLLGAIGEADREILAAVYTFTRMRLADALSKAAERGVRVRLKYDDRQREKIPQMARALGLMRKRGVQLIPIRCPEQESMHNKFVVVDGRTVVTGSFNLTVSAVLYNWENMVRIDDPNVAAAYRAGWEAIRPGGRPVRAGTR